MADRVARCAAATSRGRRGDPVAFAERPSLGLVTGDQSILGTEFWGDNEDNVAHLLRRIELELDRSRLRFAAGSMYWIRGFALQGLRALNLGAADFEPGTVR